MFIILLIGIGHILFQWSNINTFNLNRMYRHFFIILKLGGIFKMFLLEYFVYVCALEKWFLLIHIHIDFFINSYSYWLFKIYSFHNLMHDTHLSFLNNEWKIAWGKTSKVTCIMIILYKDCNRIMIITLKELKCNCYVLQVNLSRFRFIFFFWSKCADMAHFKQKNRSL